MRRAGCKGRRRRERPDGRFSFCVEGKRRRRGGEREGVCRSGRRRRNDETGSLSGRKGFWWEREREWCSGVVGEKKEADPRRAVFSSVELWGADQDDDDYWTACRCLSYLINPTALHCTALPVRIPYYHGLHVAMDMDMHMHMHMHMQLRLERLLLVMSCERDLHAAAIYRSAPASPSSVYRSGRTCPQLVCTQSHSGYLFTTNAPTLSLSPGDHAR